MSVHVLILCLILLKCKQLKAKDSVTVTIVSPVLGTVTNTQQVLNKSLLTVIDRMFLCPQNWYVEILTSK